MKLLDRYHVLRIILFQLIILITLALPSFAEDKNGVFPNTVSKSSGIIDKAHSLTLSNESIRKAEIIKISSIKLIKKKISSEIFSFKMNLILNNKWSLKQWKQKNQLAYFSGR